MEELVGGLTMDWENSLVATSAGEIVHIGEGILSYIDLTRKFPFAYPADSIKKDDIVLFISKNLQNTEANLFERIGIHMENPGNCVLFLGVYKNPEIQPIEKHGEDLFLGENIILLDTYFCGNGVKVIWDKRNASLKISINQQCIKCFLDKYDDQLLVFGENGIHYFRDDFAESRKDSNETVLNGEPFHSYIRQSDISKVKLQELFSDDIWAYMHEIKESEQKVFYYNEKAVSLRFYKKNFSGDIYFIYTIVGQEEILKYIRIESSIYHTLDCMQKEKMNSSLVPTTFQFWGNDNNLSEVKFLLQKACETNVTVLLTGESGTGKTYIAKEIHKNSKRNQKNFVHVNCAAIPYQLIESELFGYEDGAFTGAKKGGKKGYFELANEGTIFLDEIADMPLALQGKLLEVIQNRTFYRVGGTEKININVRLIAATNRDLKERVAAHEFREDLYYRINVFPIQLPPLRKRKEEIFKIVTDILPGICEKLEIEPLLINIDALEKIKQYDWPGNIRELENILEKAAILSDGKIILPEDIILPEPQELNMKAVTLKEQRELCEKQAIIAALNMYNGDKEKAAQYLDIGRTNLYDKIKKYNIRCSLDWGGQDDIE